ncbi:cyclin-A2-1-like [Canna indica]|uniref:Cyclin-A2-1-like n=1 Tax=Canna indica TaxID=4628 RepID=A0AAQ3K740_9LILI|nr:cyclin-A2-1-like [Canna indica]
MAMKKADSSNTGYGAPCGRITRARAAACRANGKVLPLSQSIGNPEKKQTHRGSSKRVAVDENSRGAPVPAASQRKKRAVLNDVTNISFQTTSRKWIPAGKVQCSGAQRSKLGLSKNKRRSHSNSSKLSLVGNGLTNNNVENKIIEGVQNVDILVSRKSSIVKEMEDSLVELQQKKIAPVGNPSNYGNVERKISKEESKVDMPMSKGPPPLEEVGDCLAVLVQKESIRDKGSTCTTSLFEENVELTNLENNGGFISLVIGIDTEIQNPQMCCTYASEIYTNQRAAELIRRPVANFMETLQRDITQSMRGILIDWLVEVSEEYRLVPDTLYLTVYIIDQFLSQNYIERQRLQLLGITCMLIASKYEEICAPRVEEFCFITDNTYTKAEVLKMETQVLSHIGFQLSVPTTKTFLRRFLRAANALDKNPTLTFGYLANYLAELTLVEYNFIKFLPSIVAASAVFLAVWTLDQTNHPWNATLEYYTSYKAIDLKETVFALQELQMNSKCPLNAIREKYRQEKFERVATLASPQLEESLFC